VSDLFSAFFGSGGFESAFGTGRGQRSGQMQGADVVVAAAIDLAQAAHGDTVEVSYDVDVRCDHCHGNGAEPGTRIVTCPRCHGSGQLQAVSRTAFGQLVRTALCDVCGGDGRVPDEPCRVCDGAGKVQESRTLGVQVPAGIADGQRIRLSGRGHAGERGGPNGDLYVVVRVREDERFVRDQEDLHTVIDVPAPLAALGTTVQVPSLDGDLPVEIPAGTQPGETITLRSRGLPPLGRGRTGDLHVHVNVVIPRRLSREQRDLFEQLADSLDDRNVRSDEGMLAKLKRALAG
jgi:molecular chaperone DnaJ